MNAPNRLRLSPTVFVTGLLLACSTAGFSCSSTSMVQSPTDAQTEALLKASERGARHRVSELVDEGANIDAADANGMTALHAAARGGHDELVRWLVARGASVNAQDAHGDTPLHLAAMAANPKCIRELLAGNASRTIKNKDGKTAADIASPNVVGLVRP